MHKPTPTAALVALLAHVRDRRVLTNESDNQVYLELPGDPPVLVSNQAEQLSDLGWVKGPADSIVWELTDAGRDVLKRGTP